MKTKRRRTLAVLGASAVLLVGLSACKATEPFQDAPVNSRNTTGADLVTFPDGFSNVATKCDHGNRVYSAFHGDSAYAAVAVVPNDPTCN